MKKILYIILTLFVFSSCASIQKKVDEGDYDGAIILAAKKLSGKKKKKTKHVAHLETAFGKVMDRDLNHIAYLKNKGDDSNWGKIHSIYQTIQNRQRRITPFLPLISKDGYVASFKFIRVEDKLIESARYAAEHHYNGANNHLAMAREGSKEEAKEAYYQLQRAQNYFKDYKDSENLIYEAIGLGQTRVLVSMRNSAEVILPLDFENEIMDIDLRELNDLWTKFYNTEPEEYEIDYRAVLDINYMDIGPEREKIIEHVETKEIEAGFQYVLDDNGNVMKDTLGNDITVPRFVTIKAFVTKFVRQKKAFVEGRLLMFDEYTGETKSMLPISANAIFNSHKCSFEGDKRALTKETKGNMRGRLLPFPSDFEITMLAAENLKRAMKGELEGLVKL